MKNCVLILCVLYLPLRPFAQSYFYNDSWYDTRTLVEAGIGIGALNAFTDLGGRAGNGGKFLKDFNPSFTRPAFSVYGALLYDQFLGFRLDLSYGTATAADSILKNDKSVANYRYRRNLSFRTRILELALLTEFYPVNLLQNKARAFSLYLLGGIGIFHYNPKAKLGSDWIPLQPLRTEGQGLSQYASRKQYRLTAICFPVGLGMRYEISALINARIEFLYRFTSSDYLDDVSSTYADPEIFAKHFAQEQAQLAKKLHDRSTEIQGLRPNSPGDRRGNPENKDSFLTVNLKIGIVLNRVKRKY